MPKFKGFQYGRFQRYGRYEIRTNQNIIGPFVKYRMRLKGVDGTGEFITLLSDYIDAPISPAYRIRANNGEWVYTQTEEIKQDIYKVRIRSVSATGEPSPWVYGETGNLKHI